MNAKEIIVKLENALSAIAEVQMVALDDETEHLCTELGGLLEVQRQYMSTQVDE